MSKPSVKVKDKEYSVSQISVVLKLNSCPLINLRLSEKLDGTETKISNEETFKQEFFQDICSEAEGSFAWGDTLKFFLVGYNSPEARTFELVGLVVKKDLIDWFNQNNFKEKKEDYLIYQKGKGKNSWSFFNMVLEDKFKQPNQDFINKTDLLFPDNGCIWRYKESNNFHFLNRAIAFASRHLPQVQGWCGFDDSKPLRLIIFEEKKQDKTIPKLDNTWTASSYPFVPNRYSWNRWLDKSSTLTRELSIQEGQEMALIKKLTSHGLNDEDGKSYQAQNPTQLLFSPGTINIGEKNIFCHTITYEFKLPAFGEESPSVTMKIEVDYPERQIGDNEIISLRLPGKFKEWQQKKDGETEIKLVASDLKNWGIIDEGSQSLKSGNDAVLSTHILSPTYCDDDYSGIYVKHEKDDEMIVDIHPCSIPLVLGSVQKYRKELEEADVTLSGQKLAISVSEHHQSLDKSEAIVLDSSEIKLNHSKKIFGQAQQQVDFLSQNVEIGSSQVKINSGKTNINSLVNISFPSPKFATPNVPSSSGVSQSNKPLSISELKNNFDVGTASGENNLCLLDTLAQLTNKYTEGSPNDLKDIFKTFLADDTQLIEVGPQQDFMDGNISENLLLALSHENKENFEIQVYDQNPDGSITKYDKFTAKDKLTGEDQYPGKKPIVLNMLREKTGDGQYHFSPLFPKEQGNVDNNESKNRQLPAELIGGGEKRKLEEETEEEIGTSKRRKKEQSTQGAPHPPGLAFTGDYTPVEDSKNQEWDGTKPEFSEKTRKAIFDTYSGLVNDSVTALGKDSKLHPVTRETAQIDHEPSWKVRKQKIFDYAKELNERRKHEKLTEEDQKLIDNGYYMLSEGKYVPTVYAARKYYNDLNSLKPTTPGANASGGSSSVQQNNKAMGTMREEMTKDYVMRSVYDYTLSFVDDLKKEGGGAPESVIANIEALTNELELLKDRIKNQIPP